VYVPPVPAYVPPVPAYIPPVPAYVPPRPAYVQPATTIYFTPGRPVYVTPVAYVYRLIHKGATYGYHTQIEQPRTGSVMNNVYVPSQLQD
jgi:hypothetical protein